MTKKESNVFILGMPRSGTTLISNMLNASKQIYIGPETHFYHVLDVWQNKKRKFLIKKDFITYFFDSNSNPYLQYLGLSQKELDVLKRSSYNGEKSILELLCVFEANKKGILKWGEKTPGHFEYVEKIYEDHLNSKIINIVRDPRDVFLSLSKVNWSNKNPLKFCLRFKKNIELIKKFKSNVSFINIKYEDLLLNPDETIKGVCLFSEIEYSNNILENFNNNDSINYDVKKEPWKANNTGKLNSINFGKWKNDISNQKTYSFISWFLKDELNYLGYEIENNNCLIDNLVIYGRMKIKGVITRSKRFILK